MSDILGIAKEMVEENKRIDSKYTQTENMIDVAYDCTSSDEAFHIFKSSRELQRLYPERRVIIKKMFISYDDRVQVEYELNIEGLFIELYKTIDDLYKGMDDWAIKILKKRGK